MSYQDAIESMFALGHELTQTAAHKFDLTHMRTLLQALNHPEQGFPAVLVAGTNGKGSTASTLASILRASGMKTALYTSPHLLRINERIQIDGAAISDEDFAKLHDSTNAIAEQLVFARQLPWHPSFFEMATAMAFQYFALSQVDIAVLEVGMGGRLDATNVVDPVISIITDISLDHQSFLGDTIAEISKEKVGIIRPGGVVVTLPQHPEANDVIGNTILKLAARAINAVPYVPPVSPASANHFGSDSAKSKYENRDAAPLSRYTVEVMGKEIVIESRLVGRHQFRNVALAIAAAVELATIPLLTQSTREKQGSHHCPITPESIARGIRDTRWPGRFQVEPAHNEVPEFIFDVAHNPAGAWALRSTLSACYGGKKVIFVFGVMRDKAVGEIAEILFPLAEVVIATQAANPRSATVAEIREAADRTSTVIEGAPTVAEAVARARVLAGSDGIVVVTGSIYIVGEAMRAMRIDNHHGRGGHLTQQRRDS